jgi:galactokinase
MQSITVKAPGRINLIGEHTDYNNGFVLPAAIQMGATTTITKRSDDEIHLTALDLNDTLKIDSLANLRISDKAWANYMIGVIVQFVKKRKFPTGFDITLTSNVPMGAGLSSSAAIECSIVYGLNELFEFGIDKMELTYMAQKAEHDFAGVQCGIMDQFASMFGKKDQVVLLDCASMEFQYFPLELKGYQVVLFDTGVKHALASSEYNTRRSACEMGVKLMQTTYPQVQSLRDANLQMLHETVSELTHNHIYKCCKYVIEEIERTQAATANLKSNDLKAFGQKMFLTHEGLSKLYEVSSPELDLLVDLVRDNENVIGARMMGGGFGGCTINIIKEMNAAEIIAQVGSQYLVKTGKQLVHYVVSVEDGVHTI